jgi:hypothetical protein
MPEVTIRFATAADAATIVLLIRALADYENLTGQVRISEADVLRDGFGERPRFECLLAEVEGAALGLRSSTIPIRASPAGPNSGSRTSSSPRPPAGAASAAN